jgi:hypothetical protein
MEVTLPRLGLMASLALLGTLLAATAVSLVTMARRSNAAAQLTAFGWATFWAVVALHTPVSLKFGTVSDRYSYGAVLAAICIAVPVVAGLDLQLPLRPALARALAGLLVAAPLPVTWARDAEWRSETTLQLALYRDHPDDLEAKLAEGMRRFQLKEYDAAYPLCLAYQRGAALPDRAGLCLGTISLLRGEPVRAARQLEPYAFARPGSVQGRVRLFQAWFAAGDLEGVRRGLEFFSPYAHQADILAASREYEKRLR